MLESDPVREPPRVCIMTGDTERVTFERVTVKAIDEVDHIKCVLLSLLTAHAWVNTLEKPLRPMELELPFSRDGFRAYTRARKTVVACAIGTSVTFAAVAGSMLLLPAGSDWQQTVPILVAAALVVGWIYHLAKKAVAGTPKLLDVGDEGVTLWIGSDEAAAAFREAVSPRRKRRRPR